MDYKKIVGQLQNLKDHCKDWADKEEPDNVWNKDVEALDEAMDIIYDYEQAVTTSARLIAKHETVKDAIDRGMGLWQCPDCQRMISYGNEYCHWCGRRLGWKPRTVGKRGKDKGCRKRR